MPAWRHDAARATRRRGRRVCVCMWALCDATQYCCWRGAPTRPSLPPSVTWTPGRRGRVRPARPRDPRPRGDAAPAQGARFAASSVLLLTEVVCCLIDSICALAASSPSPSLTIILSTPHRHPSRRWKAKSAVKMGLVSSVLLLMPPGPRGTNELLGRVDKSELRN